MSWSTTCCRRPCRRLVFPPFSLSCLRSGWPSLNRPRSDNPLADREQTSRARVVSSLPPEGRTPGAPFVVPISRHITVQNHAVDTPPENCDLWRRPEETHRRNPSHGPALPPSGRSNGPTTTNPPSQNDAQSAPPSERRSHGPSVRRFLQRLPRFCSLLQGKDAIRGPRQGPPVPTKPCPALPAAPVAHDCGRSCLPGAFGGRGWPPVAGWPSTSVKLVRFVSSITRHSPANQRPAPVFNRSATERIHNVVRLYRPARAFGTHEPRRAIAFKCFSICSADGNCRHLTYESPVHLSSVAALDSAIMLLKRHIPGLDGSDAIVLRVVPLYALSLVIPNSTKFRPEPKSLLERFSERWAPEKVAACSPSP